MEKVSGKGNVDALCIPAIMLKESKIIQKLLGRMLVLAVPCVYKGWCGGQTVALGISFSIFCQIAAQSLLPAPYNEYLVIVA